MRNRVLERLTLLVILAVCSVGALRASGGVILVDQSGGGDFLAIQEGVNSAAQGDTVLVAPGTYVENVYIGQQAPGLSIVSVAGPATTTIDGSTGPDSSVVHFEDAGTGNALIGFAITGGESYYYGGGVRCDDSDVLIERCEITGCAATRMWGGGVGTHRGSVTVRQCEISDNQGGDGGGIGAVYGDLTVVDCGVTGNLAQSIPGNQSGGGLYLSCDRAVVIGNLIEGNVAMDGGGIQDWGSTELMLEANTISANWAWYMGGGIALYGSACTATGNVISGNHADSWGGGALDARTSVTAAPTGPSLFSDNVFVANTSGGSQSAIRVHQWDCDLVLSGNFIENATAFEVSVGSTPSTDTLDFTSNWWGTDDPVEIAARIHDCNDDPGLLWCIDFSSWCTDPSCSGQVTSVEEPEGTTQASWGRIKSLYR